ncbi:MAG: hypothetical protein AB7P50_02430 [Alphaproteobacteria bacterium]
MALLRASGEHAGKGYDLSAVLGEGAEESGIPNADILVEFANSVTGRDSERLERARASIQERMGSAALVDTAGVAALFNAIDRVADSTGIPLEKEKAAATESIRVELGINDFGKISA